MSACWDVGSDKGDDDCPALVSLTMHGQEVLMTIPEARELLDDLRSRDLAAEIETAIVEATR